MALIFDNSISIAICKKDFKATGSIESTFAPFSNKSKAISISLLLNAGDIK